ncbi:MAG: SpoIIE family protein phosphatase [Ignavibacteria bacterium]|nr:SpoIIE family protein phosphatase [Ignavibacteria bacterium]
MDDSEPGKYYFDGKPNLFRSILIAFTVLFVSVIVVDSYKNASTIFTGTHYMFLPSTFYITKDLNLQKNKDSAWTRQVQSKELIPKGSFILSVNGIKADSTVNLRQIVNSLREDESVILKIFDINRAGEINDSWNKEKVISSSAEYIAKKSDLPGDFYTVLNKGVYIGYLVPGGATDNAGVKPGDVLLSIRDFSIELRTDVKEGSFKMESLRYLRNLPLNEKIPFIILRNNNVMAIDVTLKTFGIMTNHLLLLIMGFVTLIFGFFVGVKKPQFKSTRITSIAFLIIGLQISSSLNYYPPEYDTFSFVKIYLSNFLAFLIIPLLLHSMAYFPVIRKNFVKRKINLIIPYAYSLAGIIAFTVWYFINPGTINGVYFSIATFFVVLFYVISRLRTKENLSKDEKRASNIILFIFLFVSAFEFLRDFLLFGGVAIPNIMYYIFLLNFLLPVAYAYILIRYKIFDIDFTMKRNIQYNLLTVLWYAFLLSCFALIFFTLSGSNLIFPGVDYSLNQIKFSAGTLDADTNRFYSQSLLMILSIGLTYAVYRIGKYGRNYFDRKYYRQKLDYRNAQSEIVKVIQKKFTLESLGNTLAEKIATMVRLKKAGVLFVGKDNLVWQKNMFCYDSHSGFKVLKLDDSTVNCSLFEDVRNEADINSSCDDFMKSNGFIKIILIKTKQRILGAIFAGEKLSESHLKKDDLEFLNSVASNIAVLVENAFLYEELSEQERIRHEIDMAREIQLSSLPQYIPDVKGLDICAVSIPAFEVGGDFYDFLNGTEDKITVVMGDVSGKGTSAALYMSKVQGIFQTLNEFNLSPLKLLIGANKLLYKHIDSKSYITAVGANFYPSEKKVLFARAGHLPLYYFDAASNAFRKIQPGGIGLGLGDNLLFMSNLEEVAINYRKGDIFIFISDGIIEAMNRDGELYGESRLFENVMSNSGNPSGTICSRIIDSVRDFSSAGIENDDMTVVVVKSDS